MQSSNVQGWEEPAIIKTNSFRSIEKEDASPQSTLYLLDIDDTIQTLDPCALISDSGQAHFQSHCLENREKAEMMKCFFPLARSLYYIKKIRYVEPSIPETISRLINRGSTVLGFTSRHQEISQLTQAALQRLGVCFCQSVERDIPFDNDAYYSKGIIYSNLKYKSQAFIHMWNLWSNEGFPKKIAQFRRVVFIDDQLTFLEEFRNELSSHLKERGVALDLFHYTHVKDFLEDRHPVTDPVLNMQIRHLLSNVELLSNAEAEQRISKDEPNLHLRNPIQPNIRPYRFVFIVLAVSLIANVILFHLLPEQNN